MRKIFLIIVLLFLSNITFGQSKSTFKLDKLVMSHSIYESNNTYQLLIEIRNNNDFDIYIPKLINDELNFFEMGNKLYLFHGLSFSLLGEQNPDSEITLIKINSKGVYKHEINIPKKSKVEFICVGLEYLSDVKSKYSKTLSVEYDYYNKKKFTFYSEYEKN